MRTQVTSKESWTPNMVDGSDLTGASPGSGRHPPPGTRS